ncbi:hypothetical protein, partial [Segatella buccae]|uniref:hypothetical protein n=1 Tax=Segatella buccae TaxID=28126 RepID=UPI003AF04195
MSRKLRRIYHTPIFIVCKGTKNQALNQNKYHKLTLRYPKYDTKPQKRKIQTVIQKSTHKYLLSSFSRFSCHAVISARNGLETRMTADDRKACR